MIVNEYFKPILLVAAYLMFTAAGCAQTGSLEKYDLKSKHSEQIKLTKKLDEISGLAATENGTILCHDDEKGIVYELNPAKGKILNQFELEGKIRADFEGIAVKGDSVYIITSDGVIYSFRKSDKGKVAFRRYFTGLDDGYDIEGLCYNASQNALIIAAKEDPFEDKERTIFFYSLNSQKIDFGKTLIINIIELKERFGEKKFYPSGIELNNTSGSYFILSSRTHSILEITTAGEVINFRKLNRKEHLQPEGITFLKNNSMIISDEASGKKPLLTIYEYDEE